MHEDQPMIHPRFEGLGGAWDRAAALIGSLLGLLMLPVVVPLAVALRTPIWAWLLLALIYFLH